jgi:hypothetical protein
MFEDDSTYFAKRAEAELAQAKQAAVPEVAQVHQRLAEAYLERLKLEATPAIEQAT